jgi:hypothetical protein
MLYSSPVPAQSQSMLYSSPVPAHCNGTANCIVGRDWEALLLLGQNAVNGSSVKKTSLSVLCTTQTAD